ncbi:MAG TPA: methenyltetrahydromethanopterin cyclohydrolase, partial [Pirellulales bacterium]
FDDVGFRESPSEIVGVLESSELPPAAVYDYLAEKCRVPRERVTLLVAPTSSLAGSVQIVARSVETALHKLHELKFDVSRIVSGFGSAPLPPVHPKFVPAMGRTNDAILYGGRVTLFVRGDDESIAEIGPKTPSESSSDYGRPFAEIFTAAGHDFYKIDPLLFSPAMVTFYNIDSGRTHQFGRLRPDVLERSFAR